jgi:hypothetical protein
VNRLRMIAALLLLLESLPLPASPKPTPTPIPPSRKLTGGFGRGAPPDAVVTPDAGQLPGQSLADAVRASEKAKKRKGSKPGVAITNETLVTDPTKGKLTTASPRPTSPPPTPAPEEPRPTPAGEDSSGEAYWRERMHSARTRVEELTERVRHFEQEAKKLENDFYSWDDGQYRDGVIKPAWDKKREELETARRDLEQAQKELSELPEKARRAGALPGWLRE